MPVVMNHTPCTAKYSEFINLRCPPYVRLKILNASSNLFSLDKNSRRQVELNGGQRKRRLPNVTNYRYTIIASIGRARVSEPAISDGVIVMHCIVIMTVEKIISVAEGHLKLSKQFLKIATGIREK